jgi:hypothetical protein
MTMPRFLLPYCLLFGLVFFPASSRSETIATFGESNDGTAISFSGLSVSYTTTEGLSLTTVLNFRG